MEERYLYLLDEYASEFADNLALEEAILSRLHAAGVRAEKYGDSPAFTGDWSGVDFMAVSTLKDKMDSHVVHLCSQVPDVARLGDRMGSRLTALELYKLLEANGFDVEAAVAVAEVEAGAQGLSAPGNCAAAFDQEPDIQDVIAQAETDIVEGIYPDFHEILGPMDSFDRGGSLYLSNERFVGHVAAFEDDDPAEAADRNLVSIKCKSIVCCVDRPRLLQGRGYEYCQVPFGDAPSAAAELPQKMEEAFVFIDNARANGGSVVVHCNMGMSRSAAIVIGYLMRRLGWSYKDAYRHTKLRRGVVRPNDAFESVLQRLEITCGTFGPGTSTDAVRSADDADGTLPGASVNGSSQSASPSSYPMHAESGTAVTVRTTTTTTTTTTTQTTSTTITTTVTTSTT